MDIKDIDSLAEKVLEEKIVERGVKRSDAILSAGKHRAAETNTFEEAVWYVETIIRLTRAPE